MDTIDAWPGWAACTSSCASLAGTMHRWLLSLGARSRPLSLLRTVFDLHMNVSSPPSRAEPQPFPLPPTHLSNRQHQHALPQSPQRHLAFSNNKRRLVFTVSRCLRLNISSSTNIFCIFSDPRLIASSPPRRRVSLSTCRFTYIRLRLQTSPSTSLVASSRLRASPPQQASSPSTPLPPLRLVIYKQSSTACRCFHKSQACSRLHFTIRQSPVTTFHSLGTHHSHPSFRLRSTYRLYPVTIYSHQYGHSTPIYFPTQGHEPGFPSTRVKDLPCRHSTRSLRLLLRNTRAVQGSPKSRHVYRRGTGVRQVLVHSFAREHTRYNFAHTAIPLTNILRAPTVVVEEGDTLAPVGGPYKYTPVMADLPHAAATADILRL